MNEAMTERETKTFETWMKRFKVSEDYTNPFFKDSVMSYNIW